MIGVVNMPSLIDIKREVGNQPIAGLEKYVKLLSQYADRNVIVYLIMQEYLDFYLSRG